MPSVRAADVAASLATAGAATLAWPAWSAAAGAWLPDDARLAFLATLVGFRLMLTPVRAAFSWALAATAARSPKPSSPVRP